MLILSIQTSEALVTFTVAGNSKKELSDKLGTIIDDLISYDLALNDGKADLRRLNSKYDIHQPDIVLTPVMTSFINNLKL